MAGETYQLIYRVQSGRELLARHSGSGAIAAREAFRRGDREDLVSVFSALHQDRRVSVLRELTAFKAEPEQQTALPASLVTSLATQALSLIPTAELEKAAA